MIVPFVQRWMMDWFGGDGGIRSHWRRERGQTGGVCAGGSRQAAITSTTRAREPTAVSIP